MKELIRRMSWEPEIFTLCDGTFIEVGGETVLVKTFGGPLWSVIIRGGRFGRFGPPDIISYERLSFWQSRTVDRLSQKFAVRSLAALTTPKGDAE
jgi:hypothetical protein